MIKMKGQELPVSLLKFYLPDVTIDQLEEVRDYLKMPNNVVALIHMIEGYNGLMKQWRDDLEQQKNNLKEQL